MAPRENRRWRRFSILLIAGIAIGLSLAELSFRVFWPQQLYWNPAAVWEPAGSSAGDAARISMLWSTPVVVPSG